MALSPVGKTWINPEYVMMVRPVENGRSEVLLRDGTVLVYGGEADVLVELFNEPTTPADPRRSK